jgi:hypothetical protein
MPTAQSHSIAHPALLSASLHALPPPFHLAGGIDLSATRGAAMGQHDYMNNMIYLSRRVYEGAKFSSVVP